MRQRLGKTVLALIDANQWHIAADLDVCLDSLFSEEQQTFSGKARTGRF